MNQIGSVDLIHYNLDFFSIRTLPISLSRTISLPSPWTDPPPNLSQSHKCIHNPSSTAASLEPKPVWLWAINHMVHHQCHNLSCPLLLPFLRHICSRNLHACRTLTSTPCMQTHSHNAAHYHFVVKTRWDHVFGWHACVSPRVLSFASFANSSLHLSELPIIARRWSSFTYRVLFLIEFS